MIYQEAYYSNEEDVPNLVYFTYCCRFASSQLWFISFGVTEQDQVSTHLRNNPDRSFSA